MRLQYWPAALVNRDCEQDLDEIGAINRRGASLVMSTTEFH